MKKTSIIFSVSSDIGQSLAERKLNDGYNVFGTYRTSTRKLEQLKNKGVKLIHADFSDSSSVDNGCRQLKESCKNWNELIVAPGTLEPIGLFEDVKFSEWDQSFRVNYLNPLRAVRNMLQHRSVDSSVIFFAGGGTNGVADRFSAYVCSKIALIKTTELLDSEIQDAKFVIIGPGWIKTKIHEETLKAQSDAGESYKQTIQRLQDNNFGSMEELLDCIDWVVAQPKEVIGGRNISSQNDRWKQNLNDVLHQNQEYGKLRRSGNDELSHG